ncbi:heme/hemin ABC transporter substrate-binding protein [Vibrio genomosp. F10]|uniref:Hemin receptor n=1 Tax=Vibrio genomosp. F10 str. ZF-129 TaxID=1187848 RepID=A0A1E5BA66_9VIBR|nr:ABC transporter substrate-binding protein [Vibrio genomosp. F10]OEE30711.1 hemin receptor [Vibrio genomosp. F10 str. ZF-129]OEE94032.1 hemin receptor [Vibrio genomosp. F10 str. 9ZC157]OEE96365.1 hemin receptor [Vibrio genomosp. F10 str. 9ZD137]OEF08457.1 hemin receptor [Vibrio genomosp. F10 str. 9ZB36]
MTQLFTTFNTVLLLSVFQLSVSFSAHAQERIVSAGANITELFFALNAEDYLVAADSTSKSYLQGTGIAQVGYHRQLSAEGLMALNPTHLIGSPEMGPETTLKLITASNVEVLTLSSENSLSALNQRIDTIAEITGKQQQAEQLKRSVLSDIEFLSQGSLSTPPNVIFLMLSKDRPATAAGTNTPVDTIISLSGAKNPASDMIESYKPLSYEAIIALQPDYILVSERTIESFGGQDNIIKKLPLLAATPAGKNQQIISVPSSALIGGFGLQSIELAKKLNQHFTLNQSITLN